jgi:hypothetical protein
MRHNCETASWENKGRMSYDDLGWWECLGTLELWLSPTVGSIYWEYDNASLGELIQKPQPGRSSDVFFFGPKAVPQSARMLSNQLRSADGDMLGNWWFWTDFTYTVTLRLCIQLKFQGELLRRCYCCVTVSTCEDDGCPFIRSNYRGLLKLAERSLLTE